MLHPADEPRPLRTWRARWVPCGASATPISDAGSLYVSVGSRRSRGHAQGRAWTILALCARSESAEAHSDRAKIPEARLLTQPLLEASTQAEPFVVAWRPPSSPVPSMPSIFASASVTSSCLPGSTSALSMTSVSTCLSPERRITFAPHGRTGCVTPSDCGASTWPQVVRCASPVAPRDPAKAMFQPAGAGALVRAAAPASLPFCATMAMAATAARSATAASIARRWARAGGTAQVWLTARLRGGLVDEPDPELAELLRAGGGRSSRQGVGAARHLRECDDLTDVRLV